MDTWVKPEHDKLAWTTMVRMDFVNSHFGLSVQSRALLSCHDRTALSVFVCAGFMLEDRKTGACLGQVGINAGPLFPERELGWFVYGDALGNGYAYEGARAMLSCAFETRRLMSLSAMLPPTTRGL